MRPNVFATGEIIDAPYYKQAATETKLMVIANPVQLINFKSE